MNAKRIVIAIFKTCFTIGLLLVIATAVYKMCIKSYDFGYRIFAEEPMSPPPGYTTSVAIVEGKSVMEIGEMLEERGLIRSAYIFYLQELVSDYHDQLMPGVYELSTAMTPEEMMAVMAADFPKDGEDGESEGSSEKTSGAQDEDSNGGVVENPDGDEMSDDTSGENQMMDYMDDYQ